MLTTEVVSDLLAIVPLLFNGMVYASGNAHKRIEEMCISQRCVVAMIVCSFLILGIDYCISCTRITAYRAVGELDPAYRHYKTTRN